MNRVSSAAVFLVCGFIAPLAPGQTFTIEVELDGRPVEGSPMNWSSHDVTLLSRDGRLINFHPGDASRFRRTADQFESFSQSELRGQLLREFGKPFDVSGTGHYLVVHPIGQKDKWALRFEQLYRSFIHYFTARGSRPRTPQFPLVAVVFPDQTTFLRHASQNGARLLPGTLGYYSPTTNRILLYDVTAGRSEDDQNWHINAETIIHESAHQMAFNTGIHSRYAMPPRWVAEGLGTMFEAPGVWSSLHHPHQVDRINRYRLESFREYSSRRRKGTLVQLVGSDRIFRSDAQGAYAEAWALTFYLTETRPRQYIQYLRKTASREAFTSYRGPDRLQDFTDVFGNDLELLEAKMLRFVSGL